MEQQRVVAYESFLHKSWATLLVTNSIVVIILNSLLLPITEEVRKCTGHRPLALMFHVTLRSAFCNVSVDCVTAYENF